MVLASQQWAKQKMLRILMVPTKVLCRAPGHHLRVAVFPAVGEAIEVYRCTLGGRLHLGSPHHINHKQSITSHLQTLIT